MVTGEAEAETLDIVIEKNRILPAEAKITEITKENRNVMKITTEEIHTVALTAEAASIVSLMAPALVESVVVTVAAT
jgi:hypothetical protein